MFEIRNLYYSVAEKPILRNISFGVAEGEFIGLLGPNGAGKTTLLRILSGTLRDYEGIATYKLLNINQLSPKSLARSIAVVPQETYFAFSHTVIEVVLMGRSPFQRHFAFESKEDIQIARAAMERTDCWQFANRTIDTLSGGEKQRVLLARALTQNPKVLLLDEPASHLDLKHQQSLFRLLKEINKKDGVTIICVAHDLNTALTYYNRLLLLKDGELLFQGETKDVMNEKNIEKVFDIVPKKVVTGEGSFFFFPENF